MFIYVVLFFFIQYCVGMDQFSILVVLWGMDLVRWMVVVLWEIVLVIIVADIGLTPPCLKQTDDQCPAEAKNRRDALGNSCPFELVVACPCLAQLAVIPVRGR